MRVRPNDVRGLLVVVLGLLMVALVLMEAMSLFWPLNRSILEALPSMNSRWVELISLSGGGEAFAAYVIVIICYDLVRRRRIGRFSAGLVLALVFGTAIVWLLKAFLQIPRPGSPYTSLPLITALAAADNFAFPSGHALRATVLAYYVGGKLGRAGMAMWAWAFLVCLSRLLLHVHWLSDVVFSAVLGIWVSLLTEGRGSPPGI